MIWTRRSLLMGALLGLPVLFAVLYRAVLVAKLPAQMTGFDLYGVIVALYVLSNALPLITNFVCKAVDSKGTRQFGKKQAAMMLYELFKVGLYPEYWSVNVDRDVWCHNKAQELRRNLSG